MIKTYDDFLIAVKQQFEVAKNGKYSSFLLHPSPAQLRNLCLLLLENSLSKSDEEIFSVFFQVTEGKDLKRSIENFDIEKFKAIGNFLKGSSTKTNAVSINLISILVDFEPRPFNKYLKANTSSTTEVSVEKENNLQDIKAFVFGLSETSSKEAITSRSIFDRRWSRLGLVLLLILGSGYLINLKFFPNKECMQWQNDHYERVDCSAEKQQGLITQNDIIPIDNTIINLRRIEVNEQTQFFRNDKPLVWYCKANGKLTYFNFYGINPETGKPLKPMTNYMIKKYVLKQAITSK
jgi:hypothetical protein